MLKDTAGMRASHHHWGLFSERQRPWSLGRPRGGCWKPDGGTNLASKGVPSWGKEPPDPGALGHLWPEQGPV